MRLQPTKAPPRCTKCNSPSMNVLLYNGPLLYDCNVPIRVLMCVEDGKCSVKVLSPFQFCVQQ